MRHQLVLTWQTRTVALAALSCAVTASGQQSFHNISAAQPSPGITQVRQTYQFIRLEDDPTDLDRVVNDFQVNTTIAHGLTHDLSLILTVPLVHHRVEERLSDTESTDFHVGDLNLMAKWRVWKHDTGPIDTMRFSVLAGLDIPTGKHPLGNESWDPVIGVVFTSIQGRHGVNAALRWKFNTGERESFVRAGESKDDILYADFAYLYRIDPPEYTADTKGAWYLMAELNGTYETNGDHEWMIGPGIMYEARNWVFEVSVQLPVLEKVDHRPPVAYTVGMGFRILF